MPEAFVTRVFCWSVGCLPRAFSGSSSGQRLLCFLDVRLLMASWLWLGSAFGVVAFVTFLVFPLPPLPIRGSRGFSSIIVTSHGKTYTNVLTFNGQKRQLAVSHRQSAVSNLLVNVRRFHQTVRRFQQTVSSMEKALVVTL